MQRLGVEGRLVIAFTMAGGLMGGGLLVATATFSGSMTADALPSFFLFVIGSVLGWVHAVLLGYTGREAGTSRQNVVSRILAGGAWSVPALLLALMAALGMALSGIFVRTGGVFALVMVALSWLVGTAICVWAVVVGFEAFRNAVVRYPEARLGSILLILLLLVLLFLFERSRPAIWGTDNRVTATGAAILAFGATIWIGAPVLFTFLHLIHGRISPKKRIAL
jgi:hypothetical protein